MSPPRPVSNIQLNAALPSSAIGQSLFEVFLKSFWGLPKWDQSIFQVFLSSYWSLFKVFILELRSKFFENVNATSSFHPTQCSFTVFHNETKVILESYWGFFEGFWGLFEGFWRLFWGLLGIFLNILWMSAPRPVSIQLKSFWSLFYTFLSISFMTLVLWFFYGCIIAIQN